MQECKSSCAQTLSPFDPLREFRSRPRNSLFCFRRGKPFMGVRSPGPIYYHSWQKTFKAVALSPPKTWGRGAHPILQRPFQSQPASAPQIRTLSDTQVTVPFLSIPVRPAQTVSSTKSNLEPKVVPWTKTGLMVGGEGSPRQTNPPHFPQALGPFHCTQELGYCTYSSSSHTLW